MGKLSVRELIKREVNKKSGDLNSYKELVKKKQGKMSKFWLKPVEFDHIGTSQLIKKKFNDYIKYREKIRSLLEEPSNRQELTRQVLDHVN